MEARGFGSPQSWDWPLSGELQSTTYLRTAAQVPHPSPCLLLHKSDQIIARNENHAESVNLDSCLEPDQFAHESKPFAPRFPELAIQCCTERPTRYKQSERLYIGTQIRLLSRAMKLLAQLGQPLFGTLVLENLRKGPASLHRTNLET